MEQGICKLCGAQADLRRSHVIPEAFYTPVYEAAEHQFFPYSSDMQEQRPLKRRKGLREPLLCPACEDITQLYDDYASKIWDGSDRVAQFYPHEGGLIVKGVDYSKMKLFFIITLWRAGVSTLAEFSKVQLGSDHEKKLRKMILDGNPGMQYEYPLFLLAARKDPRVREILQHAIFILGSCNTDGHNGYRFFIGGFLWHIFVSSHLEGTYFHLQSSLKENGELWIYQQDDLVERELLATAKMIKQNTI